MLNSFRLKAFIACRDIQRARDFYVDTLGCGLIERTPYAVVLNAGGTEVRITLVDYFEPQQFVVLGFEVGDVRAEVAALRAKGVEFLEISSVEQDEDLIYHVPGGGEVAWFIDTEGNQLTLQRTIS
ncbi:MAG: VOC family protein [Solirubrobacteraceae bacterium]|nr:VOC family protein [Solirubrobacteraceae bacterium]